MLSKKRIMVIPIIFIFFISCQFTSFIGYAEESPKVISQSSIIKLQIIEELDEVKLAKAMYNDKTTKDVVIFKDGVIEEYNELVHGKFFKKDKISKRLKDKIDKAGSDEKITVSVWIGDIDHHMVEKYVKEKLNIEDIKNENSEKIKSYIEEERKKSKEEYAKQIDKFVKKYLKDQDELFISEYSPLIITNILRKDIYILNKDIEVQAMDLFEDSNKEEDTTYSIANINSNYVRDTLNLKGNGVKVGILEVGYPNKNNSQLTGSAITFDVPDSTASKRLSTHATIVTSIIMGQTQGIAPEITAYVATASNRLGDYQKIEWLIDQGVSIINYSAGYSDIRGQYSDMAKWIDHLGVQYDVIFVKSAGNVKLSDYTITDPGMAFNALTVASIKDNDSLNEPYWVDDTYSSFSCYSETSGPFKPDLTAPGEGINVADYTNSSGTSFSAPHVVGVLAQILGAYPNIFPRNNTLKALITANTNHKTANDYGEYQLSPFLSNKEGAGVIDALSVYNCINNIFYLNESLDINQFPYTHYLNINADGQPVRVSLSWLKNNTITVTPYPGANVTERELSDLDMEIYDPDGNLVCYSMSANNNMEIVEFTPTVSGNYMIRVDAYTLINSTEQISLAWSRAN